MYNRVKEVRKARDLTLHDLERATGLNNGHISSIENGKTVPSVVNAQLICRALGATVEYVFPLLDGEQAPGDSDSVANQTRDGGDAKEVTKPNGDGHS